MSRLYITNNEIDKAGHFVKKNTFVQFSFGSRRSKQHVKGLVRGTPLTASIVLKQEYVCHCVFLF